MWSHPAWCLVVALSVFASGSKVPRQIVYQIRPAPVSAFASQDGTFVLDDGTEYQFPTFGLKTPENKSWRSPTATTFTLSGNNESGDVDSSSSSSSSASSSPSEEGSSAVTKEEISEVPKFGTSQVKQVNRQILQLQPEQIQQIFNAYKPQVQHIQQQQQQQQHQQQLHQEQQQENIEVGPRYEYKSIEENTNTSADDIKTAQTEVITEEKLQSAYSERREKRKRKQQEQPPGDASYAFGYETDEAARHEVADPDGTVKGWYTYVDDEGTVRKIIYTAGAGKGFVVLGKEKIKGPGTASPPQHQQSSRRKYNNRPNNRVNTDYGFAADSSTISSLKHQKPASTPSSFNNYFNNWNDLAKAGTSNPPGPTTIIATAETPTRTKKPVFIVKIRRPVNKDQYTKTGRKKLYNLEMAGDSSSSLLLLSPPSKYLVNAKQKHLSDPEPLPLPVTSLKSATRTRRRPTMTLSDVVPSLRKSRIKKYPTPPIYYADDDDESGYDASSSQGSSASSSGEYDSDHDSGEHHNGGGNYGGGGGRGGGGGLPVKSDPDSSYVFGYETDSANRLEKADPYGNVRGSYSYIDPDGVKRTVHYIAGGNTGFQVIHASPSISRGVRLEAPPGYVVKRVPSLRTAESRYPIPITVPQPSAIVYHIHPDSGWKPWEPTLRKKKVKIHRKKLPKEFFENARRDGIVLLQTHPDPAARVTHTNFNTGAPSGSVSSGSSNTYFKEKVTAAGSGTVTATETQIPYVHMSPPISRRRHAPQRGYTAEHHVVQIDDDGSLEHTAATAYHHQPKSKSSSSASSPQQSSSSGSSSGGGTSEPAGPGIYSPAPFESMRESIANSRMPSAPNPVQLQPTQVAIKSRGAPAQGSPGLDTSSSNHHPVAFTSDGKLQVDVPTVIIEAIEAKSSSSVTKKDENYKNVTPAVFHHHQLPEAAALTQSTSSVAFAAPSTSNLIKASTPTSSPAAYELVSASSVSYQPSSVSAPTPPAASASSFSQNSQKSYTPILSNNNNVLNHHQYSSSSQSSSPVASSAAPPRSRRRHHRSKTAATTAPTSPSSVSSASSSSSNTIKTVASGNLETTTTMSSSKRLINRLAAADHDATAAANQ